MFKLADINTLFDGITSIDSGGSISETVILNGIIEGLLSSRGVFASLESDKGLWIEIFYSIDGTTFPSIANEKFYIPSVDAASRYSVDKLGNTAGIYAIRIKITNTCAVSAQYEGKLGGGMLL